MGWVGPAEAQGVFRYTDEHHSERKVKMSLYNVVYIEPGSENEIVPVEISYNIGTKAAMITVKRRPQAAILACERSR